MRLSYRTAGRIAWRETRSSMTKFLFVVLAVAAGVGALAGVQGFSASFRGTLLDESRTVMAADLTARQFAPASEREVAALDALAQRGVEHTLITETISMASSAQAAPNSDAATPVLVSIKAVDPSKYPYYGAVTLDPPLALRDSFNPIQSPWRRTCCCGLTRRWEIACESERAPTGSQP
jgi:putative ABC transport system permease protein